MPAQSRSSTANKYAGPAIAAIVVAAPVLIAGAHPITQVALSAATLVVAAFYLHRIDDARVSPFVVVALIGLAASAVQLLPLPAAAVRLLSPRAHELRAQVGGPALGWIPLTLDAPATILEVCKGFCYVGLLVIVTRFARRPRRAARLLHVIAFVGGGIATLALIQRAVHAEKILGFYAVTSMPGSGFFGTIVNGNNAASLFSLSCLVAIGCAVEARQPMRAALAVSAAVACATAVMTGSRAGTVGLIIGGVVLAQLLMARRLGAGRAAAITLVLATSIGVAALVPDSGLRARFRGAETLLSNQKTRGWRDSVELVADFPLVGVGRGAFEAPATAYRDEQEEVRLVYPENIVLQLATEWGLPITVILLLLFGAASLNTARRLTAVTPGVTGAACGIVAVLVHELADFGLEMPGIAIPTVVALAVVTAQSDELGRVSSSRDWPRPIVSARARALTVGAWALAVGAGLWAIPRTLFADGIRSVSAIEHHVPGAVELIASAQRRHPADYYLELLVANEAARTGSPDVLARLNRVLRLSPGNAAAHLMAARWLVRLGRNAQAALEYRLAQTTGPSVPIDEIVRATGSRTIDALPQRPDHLFRSAYELMARGQAALARQACDRAVELSGNTPDAMSTRLQFALSTKDVEMVTAAASALLEVAPDASAYVAASNAYESVGAHAASERAVAMGVAAYPRDFALILSTARVRAAHGDVAGAREVLARISRAPGAYSVADRIAAEGLAAELADRVGDDVSAALARARAKQLQQRLSTMIPGRSP